VRPIQELLAVEEIVLTPVNCTTTATLRVVRHLQRKQNMCGLLTRLPLFSLQTPRLFQLFCSFPQHRWHLQMANRCGRYTQHLLLLLLPLLSKASQWICQIDLPAKDVLTGELRNTKRTPGTKRNANANGRGSSRRRLRIALSYLIRANPGAGNAQIKILYAASPQETPSRLSIFFCVPPRRGRVF
jgi:hypothetical protein